MPSRLGACPAVATRRRTSKGWPGATHGLWPARVRAGPGAEADAEADADVGVDAGADVDVDGGADADAGVAPASGGRPSQERRAPAKRAAAKAAEVTASAPRAPAKGCQGPRRSGPNRRGRRRSRCTSDRSLGQRGTVIRVLPERLRPLVEATSELAERFVAGGHSLYLVGGSVRDAIVSADGASPAEPPDLDFTTDARPEEVEAVLAGWADAVWSQGRRFGTIGARKGERVYEITTHRAEAYRPDSRKPSVAFGDR